LGPVPLELADVYPVGPYLGPAEFAARARSRSPSRVSEELAALGDPELDLDRDWASAWDERQMRSLLEWFYGPEAAASGAEGARAERSRRTGRLRRIVGPEGPLFVVGSDAVARPTFRGAARLRAHRPGLAGRIVVADDAVPFVREGRSVFARFVTEADPELVPDASAILVDSHDDLLGVGRLLLAPHEMATATRGVAVWVTSHARSREEPLEDDAEPMPDDPA
jgi:predicted RNA-binding protein (TIGR00451 family)